MERKVIVSKVLCPHGRKVPFVKIMENQDLAPCELYNGWVERRWCFLKCKHFNGLYLFETEKFVKPERIRKLIEKVARAKLRRKERDAYLEEVRRHPPVFIADDVIPWGEKWKQK